MNELQCVQCAFLAYSRKNLAEHIIQGVHDYPYLEPLREVE